MRRFAHVLLLLGDRYVLQLRDDKPGIAAPGMWSLFGGALEDGETSFEAIIREVREELTLTIPRLTPVHDTEAFSEFFGEPAFYTFFEFDCTAVWGSHHLREGRDAKPFTFDQLQELPIPKLMRQILAMHHRGEFRART